MSDWPQNQTDLGDRVDLACDAFEQAWQAGERPKLDEYLSDAADQERAAFFQELLPIELAFRRRNNETPTVDEYVARFPKFGEIVGRLVERLDDAVEAKPHDKHAQQRFPIRLNCPHCKNPIAIVDDSADEDVLCPSCGSSFRLDPDRTVTWSPEKLPKLDKFELLEPVGRGAFGTVYKAHDTELDRIVAVKVPRSGTFATQEDEDRFVREGRSAAQLSHESIVSVHEVGRTHEFPYIVSEFVHGVTLAELLDSATGRKFTFRESAELVAQIVEGLEHSHQRGVIHRDLKPSNLLIEGKEHPRVKIMDFGLARRDDREITMTVDGQVLGTPAYMSPEQARGEGHRADGRTDIYSLGVILYKLLTGELPFQGSAHMVRHQHIHDEPRPPRRLNEHVPRDLETICLKAMAKEPPRRYQTAREFANDLRCFLEIKPIAARPVGRLERTRRWCRRNPQLSISLCCALVATMILAIGGPLVAFRQTQLRAAADFEASEHAKARERMREALYTSNGRVLLQAWDDGDLELLDDTLSRQAEKDLAELRGFEWWFHRRKLAEARDASRFLDHGNGVFGVDYYPDGNRLLSAGWWTDTRAAHQVWNVKSGTQEFSSPIASFGSPTHAVSVSPIGNTIATIEWGGVVRLFQSDSLNSNKVLNTRESVLHGGLCQVQISPDGTRIAAWLRPGTIQQWNLDTGHPTTEVSADGPFCYSNDGKSIVSSNDGHVRFWNASTGRMEHTLPGRVGRSACLVASQNGEFVACGTKSGRVYVWDLIRDEICTAMKLNKEGMVHAIAFSPDGTLLAAADENLIHLASPFHGRTIALLRGHSGVVWSLKFSPDGRTLASGATDGVRLWNVSSVSSDDIIRLPDDRWQTASVPSSGKIADLAVSSDGSFLAVAEGAPFDSASVDTGWVHLWDLNASAYEAHLAGHLSEIVSLALSRDNSRIASLDQEGELRVWNARERRLDSPPRQVSKTTSIVRFGRATDLLVAGGNSEKVTYWRDLCGDELSFLNASEVTGLAISADDQHVACAGADETIRFWDLASGKCVTTWSTESVFRDLHFSPDGKLLAGVKSPNGGLKSAGVNGDVVFLFDRGTGEVVHEFDGHRAFVYDIAFSPDGRRLVSASRDHSLRLWDTASGEVLLILDAGGWCTNVAFSGDGATIASSNLGNKIRLWRSREIAEESATRSLTPEHVRQRVDACTSFANSCLDRERAVRYYEKSLAILQKAIQRHPGDLGTKRRLGQLYDNVHRRYLGLNQHADAIRTYQKVLAIRDELQTAMPGNLGYKNQYALGCSWLAALECRHGNVAATLPLAHRAVELGKELVQIDESEDEFRGAMSRHLELMSEVQAANGNLNEAIQAIRKSIGFIEQFVREPDSDSKHVERLLDTYSTLSRLLWKTERSDEVQQLYHHSRAVLQSVQTSSETRLSFSGAVVEKSYSDTAHKVRFRFRPNEKRDLVCVAGTFNGWRPKEHKMEGPNEDGFYETTLRIEDGWHEYKFVIDGKHYRHDQTNPIRVGRTGNSYLWVGAVGVDGGGDADSPAVAPRPSTF